MSAFDPHRRDELEPPFRNPDPPYVFPWDAVTDESVRHDQSGRIGSQRRSQRSKLKQGNPGRSRETAPTANRKQQQGDQATGKCESFCERRK
jgi:hypothetical protein